MIACNIGIKNKIVRAVTGFILNALLIGFQVYLPLWLFWVGIIISYAIVFQGVVGVCYLYAMLGIKDMK